MKTFNVGRAFVDVRVYYMNSRVEWPGESDATWLSGKAEIRCSDILRNTLTIKIGCWLDTDDDHQLWNISHEGGRILKSIITGEPEEFAEEVAMPYLFPEITEQIGSYVCEELREQYWNESYDEDPNEEEDIGGYQYGESLSKNVIEASKRLDGRKKSKLCNEDYEDEYEKDELKDMENMLISMGDTFAGHYPEDQAIDWLDHGFTVDSAESWAEIGCWNAAMASVFVLAGLTPEQVEDAAERVRYEHDRHSEYGVEYPYSDPIYAACNYDLDPDVIINIGKE